MYIYYRSLSWLGTGTSIINCGVKLVEQELLMLPEHMSSPPVLVGFMLLDLYVYVL